MPASSRLPSYSYSSMRCDGNEPAPTEDERLKGKEERKRKVAVEKDNARCKCVQLKGDDELGKGKSNRHCGSNSGITR